ncbi:MAG: hypothetical protein IPJ01_10670 [Micavibrio sp.]|nr:hypothetical protein [Micavibrio sp.]
MGSVIEYKECECGNQEMTSDYHYKSDELYEFCDVCGYYHSVSIKNKPEDGKYPEDWKPDYDESEGKTGYVIKIFENNTVGHLVSCIEKEHLKEALQNLKKDEVVSKFTVTFKSPEGFWQTQIFNKPVLKKFEVTSLIDVVSDNPEDYTVKDVVMAKDEIDALKKVAISMVKEEFVDTIQWIKNIKGNLQEVINELMGMRLVVTDVREI